MNLESTQELKAFVTIDLAKINKDRQNQLKLALEDNLKEKEVLLNEVQSSLKHQKEDYSKICASLEEKGRELDGEVAKLRDHMNSLKRQAS